MKIILFTLMMIQIGCTTGKGLSDSPEFWYSHNVFVLGMFGTKIYYCKSNNSGSSAPRPVCYPVEVEALEGKRSLFMQ